MINTLTATMRSSCDLDAPVDDSEAAAPDFLGVSESGRTQLRDDGGADVTLRSEGIAVHL